jgi:signal transduction histidine kinase
VALVKDGWDPDWMREQIKTIHSLCERGLTNIDRIRTFARTGRLEPKKLPLNGVIQGCLARVEAKLEEKGIRVKTEFGDLSDAVLDETTIKLAFQNIFGNSIKYLGRGTTLTVTTNQLRRNEICVCVRDTGVGFPPAVLGDFNSSGAGAESSGEVPGLGLLIASGVVELHGGKMRIQNSPDSGALIEITLKNRSALNKL